MNEYRVTLSWTAPRLTVAVLRWAVAVFAHPDAPNGLRLRVERVK